MPINKLMWNPTYEKIVTVDDSNSLVVWNKNDNDLYNSQMVNNRGVSKIVDVRWSKSGRQISFLYEDGHIYSGTVDGKNTWFNNFEEETSFIEYSPNDDKILISKKKEKIFVLASSGKQIGEITLFESIKNFEIANISWWGKNTENIEGDCLRRKHLMIAFKNGIIILVDDETDENPVVIKTELKKITKTQWEVDGLCLAVLGENVDNDEIKEEDEDDKDSKVNDKEEKKDEEKEINTKEEKSKKSKTISKRSSMNENNNINNISKSGMIENNNIEKSGMIENNSIEKSGMIENNSNNIEKKDITIENNKKEKTGMLENNNINNNLNITNLNINSKNKSLILFYNVQGELLKRFVCPCQVNSFSWGNSSTLALAADKYIYIAFAKFKHKWTYLNDTIVFAYLISDQKYNIIFKNTIKYTKQYKIDKNLIKII